MFKSAFLRGKEAKKVHGFGRGIGVYVTGHIINAHKGKIWAESPARSATMLQAGKEKAKELRSLLSLNDSYWRYKLTYLQNCHKMEI